MDSQRWRRIEDLYHAALTLAPEAQQAFLKDACGEDDELRREVESLLVHDEAAGSFLKTRPSETETVAADAALAGRHLALIKFSRRSTPVRGFPGAR